VEKMNVGEIKIVEGGPSTPPHRTMLVDVQMDNDTLLQASRRVDWRFLLPNPNLGAVAYIGPARSTLIDSLRLFSDSLTMIAERPSTSTEQYDIVVAHNPSSSQLRNAIDALRPQGWLYMEGYHPFSLSRLRRGERPRFSTSYLRALRQRGLDELAAYWHWPNFEACTEIVPLLDSSALLLSLGRRRSGKGSFLKAILSRALVRSGALPLLAPCFSVVARKGH
jgi:hypothetical protein